MPLALEKNQEQDATATMELMTHLIVAAEATSSAIPSYNQDGTPLGSPGITGFLATMILGIMIIFLGLDMTRRARRLKYRNDYAMAREAELKAVADAEKQDAAAPVPPATAEEGVAEQIRRAH